MSKKPPKLLLIFNPNAGSGRAQKTLPLIKDHLTKNQQDFDVLMTDYAGHAQALVSDTALHQYQAVIACGGDGTLFEVVNGLMAHDAEQRIPLGVVPVGTGNAFSRELGLQPSDWQKGLDIVLKQQTTAIDVAHAQCKDNAFYFINIIGWGFAVDCGQTTMKVKKLGKISYTLATLWQTIKLKKHPITVTLDGEKREEELVMLEVANSRYTGTSFLIAPDAQIDDGLLDVIMLKKISRPKILSLFPTIYSGQHVHYKEVETRQVKSITIETHQAMPLMPDGEFIGETPVTISCVPKALQLLQ